MGRRWAATPDAPLAPRRRRAARRDRRAGRVVHRPDPYQRDDVPAFGLYLDDHWDPSWPHAHVHWPDFGVPADAVAFRAALADVLARARRGERVEVACIGGHGRTGTALACLAILVGLRPTDAVAWVRDAYCDGAVETEEQRAFVEAFDPGR